MQPSVPDPPEIATFDRPPVVEVVAAVRTTSMRTDTFHSLGYLWRQHLREKYPNFNVAPPYKAPIETFGEPLPQSGMKLELSPLPDSPRLMLHSDGGQELLQLQADWFGSNWRRVLPNDQYDRWLKRRAAFVEDWSHLSNWVTQCDDEQIPLQCEVTYVNHVRPVPGLWKDHGDVGVMFGPEVSVVGQLEGLEQATWQGIFRLPTSGEPRGRVTASIQPARALDGSPIVVLQITGRTNPRPDAAAMDGTLEALDAARNAVVGTFVRIISTQAKEAWGMRS